MQGINAMHSFEVPLYKAPSQTFRETLHWFSHSQAFSSAFVKYFNGLLTFTFIAEDGTERNRSVRPIASGLSYSQQSSLMKHVSSFASKFNCAMALSERNASYRLRADIVEPDDTSTKLYGNSVCAIIRVTIIVTSLPIEMALNSLFTVIDLSPQESDLN